MLIVGIDPGLTGACAILDHNGLRAVFDMPTMPVPGAGPKALVKNKVDGRALCQLLRQHCPAAEGKPSVVLEAVGTMGGANNAVQTQGSLLRSLGAIETVIECMGWPLEYAAPQKWKKRYELAAPKDQGLTPAQKTSAVKRKALETARKLFPGQGHHFARAKDHNRAESALLGYWKFREVA